MVLGADSSTDREHIGSIGDRPGERKREIRKGVSDEIHHPGSADEREQSDGVPD